MSNPAGYLLNAPQAMTSGEFKADLVGVARPYLARQIDLGAISLHSRVGNERRVLRSALLAWHGRERDKQRAALGELGGPDRRNHAQGRCHFRNRHCA